MIVVFTIIIFLIIGGIYTYIDKRNKVYCPKCEEVYIPNWWVDLDGAYFGPNFPHVFLEAFPNQI